MPNYLLVMGDGETYGDANGCRVLSVPRTMDAEDYEHVLEILKDPHPAVEDALRSLEVEVVLSLDERNADIESVQQLVVLMHHQPYTSAVATIGWPGAWVNPVKKLVHDSDKLSIEDATGTLTIQANGASIVDAVMEYDGDDVNELVEAIDNAIRLAVVAAPEPEMDEDEVAAQAAGFSGANDPALQVFIDRFTRGKSQSAE